MSKFLKLRTAASFLAVIFLMSFWKDERTNGNSISKANAATNSKVTERKAEPAKALEGKLDKLYVSVSDFMKRPDNRKIVFSFTFRADKLTLFGWSCKQKNCNVDFNTEPDIQLKNLEEPTEPYGPNVVFGNVIILRNDVRQIKEKIKGYDYVVFIPKRDGEYIKYEIWRARGTDLKRLTTDNTGFTTNPSPPKVES